MGLVASRPVGLALASLGLVGLSSCAVSWGTEYNAPMPTSTIRSFALAWCVLLSGCSPATQPAQTDPDAFEVDAKGAPAVVEDQWTLRAPAGVMAEGVMISGLWGAPRGPGQVRGEFYADKRMGWLIPMAAVWWPTLGCQNFRSGETPMAFMWSTTARTAVRAVTMK